MTLTIPKWLLVLGVVAVALGVVYAYGEWSRGDYNRAIVERYCNYGSTTRAQYEGCVDHVEPSDVSVRYSPTRPRSAAAYALKCNETDGAFTPRRVPACLSNLEGWGDTDTPPPMGDSFH